MIRKILRPSFYLLCLLVYTSFNGCITYKAVQIKEIKSVEPLNNDISSGKLKVNLRIENPNTYAIKVKKYDLHAFVNSNDLGLIDVDKKIVIPKKSDKEYTITFSPDLNKILEILPTLFLTNKAEVALKGDVKVKAFLLSKKFSVDLKKKVSISDLK